MDSITHSKLSAQRKNGLEVCHTFWCQTVPWARRLSGTARRVKRTALWAATWLERAVGCVTRSRFNICRVKQAKSIRVNDTEYKITAHNFVFSTDDFHPPPPPPPHSGNAQTKTEFLVRTNQRTERDGKTFKRKSSTKAFEEFLRK